MITFEVSHETEKKIRKWVDKHTTYNDHFHGKVLVKYCFVNNGIGYNLFVELYVKQSFKKSKDFTEYDKW